MASGVLLFQGMHVGVLPGDLKFSIDESGNQNTKLILSTAYNVLPIWLRIASDSLVQARVASENIVEYWCENDEQNKALLVSELEPSLQVFVSCGIALDALYDQLRPYAGLSKGEKEKWKNGKSKTGRADHISETIRRVFKIKQKAFKGLKKSIKEIIRYRDRAVHPSLQLKNSCTRPDIPVGVDWKFAAYRFSNSEKCFSATMQILIFLYENKSGKKKVDAQIKNVMLALQELKVVTLNT